MQAKALILAQRNIGNPVSIETFELNWNEEGCSPRGYLT